MPRNLTSFALAALPIVVAAGCTLTTTAPSPSASDGGGGSPATGCVARCKQKATACELDSSDYNCSSYVCIPSVSDESLRCFEETACETIHSSSGVCGFSYWRKVEAPVDASTGAPSGKRGKLGDPCTCSGEGTVICQSSSGPCASDLACLDNHGVCALTCDDGTGKPKASLCPSGFGCSLTEVGNYCLEK